MRHLFRARDPIPELDVVRGDLVLLNPGAHQAAVTVIRERGPERAWEVLLHLDALEPLPCPSPRALLGVDFGTVPAPGGAGEGGP